jgi:multidrug efflux system membrane fusion protein
MSKLKYFMAAGLLGLCLSATVLAAEVSAVVAWSQKVELGTLVSGVVDTVHVRPGQQVGRGDALVTLDDRGFKGEVSRHLAVHRHAQAALEEARREDERAIELYDRTVLSDFERNQAQIALQAARARAAEAHADLIQARLDLERSVVRAPFDGMVLAVNASPGQTIVSAWQSQPLVILADNRVYRARAQVSAAQASQLEPGAELRATLGGQTLSASVSYVGFEPVGQAGQGPLYELVAEIRVEDGRSLRVGEAVVLHLD